MFSKKASKIDEIFTVDLTLCSKRKINGEDFDNFRGLLRKYELWVKLLIRKYAKVFYVIVNKKHSLNNANMYTQYRLI